MLPTCPTTARRDEDRRTELRAFAGGAASLALHAVLLGTAWASAPPLGEALDDEPLPEQQYLIGPRPEPLPPPDSACIVAGWCLASATWSLGVPIPGSLWAAPPEVRACFGDDGEPGIKRGSDPQAVTASRLQLGELAPGSEPLPWRSAALAIGAGAGTPQPTVKLAALVTRGAMSRAREDAQAWIEELQERHLACYERALRDTPWLRGRAQVTLTLEDEDVALEVKGSGGVELDDALLCCLRGAQEELRYASRWEGQGTIRYTLELHPGGK